MINNTVYFHIGTQKTGSSYIQKNLEMNYQKLVEQNFLLIDIRGDLTRYYQKLRQNIYTQEEKIIYSYVCNPDKIKLYKNIEYYEDEVINSVRKQLHSGNKNIIISQEGFFDWHPLRFKSKLQLMKKIINNFFIDYQVVIIIYFRCQDSFLESLYYQCGRDLAYKISFTEFINQFKILSNKNSSSHLSLDWCDFINYIKIELPETHILARSYEIASQVDLLKDFYDAIDINCSDFPKISETTNPGLNKHGMKIMLNSGFLDLDDRRILLKLLREDEMFIKKKYDEKYSLFSDEQRLDIYHQFVNSNQELFGLSDELTEELFYPAPTMGQSILNEDVDEMTLFLINKVVDQNKIIIKKSTEHKLKLIKKNSYDRLPSPIKLYILHVIRLLKRLY